MPWLTERLDAEQYWPNVSEVEDFALSSLLTSARIQCEAFAPALPEGAEVPENYRFAQALQARALYRAGLAGTGDQIGADGLTVTVFPMDWQVKALLRPKRGVPVIR
jgi:hypothetical protein